MNLEILQATTYKMSDMGSCSYAYITLTDIRENTGMISIESDYGNWSHSWGAMGGDIRDFILRTRKDYLMDKFTYGGHPDRNVFKFDETIKRIKQEILQAFKEGDIEESDYNYYLAEVNDLDSNAPDNKDAFYMYADNHSPKLFDFYDWESFPIETDYAGGLKAFMDEVLPLFQDVLRKEK